MWLKHWKALFTRGCKKVITGEGNCVNCFWTFPKKINYLSWRTYSNMQLPCHMNSGEGGAQQVPEVQWTLQQIGSKVKVAYKSTHRDSGVPTRALAGITLKQSSMENEWKMLKQICLHWVILLVLFFFMKQPNFALPNESRSTSENRPIEF